MNINFNSDARVQPELSSITKTTPARSQVNFAETFKNAIDHLNQLQNESDRLTGRMAAGHAVDLHHVMITAQKASITLEATVQIQQKVLDAYNEIMRMQV